MAKPKVVLRVPTVGKRAGDTIEVADAETADQMVALGQAVRVKRVKGAAKSDKD